MTSVKLDLDADLRISRGSVPASTSCRGAKGPDHPAAAAARRAPCPRTRIDRPFGLSRVTCARRSACVRMASAPARLGYLVADPVEQESVGVRTITEVLLSCVHLPQVDGAVTLHRPAPQRSETLGLVEVSYSLAHPGTAINPGPSRCIPGVAQLPSRCYRQRTETICDVERRLVYALHRLPTKSMAAGASRRSRRAGSPVLVVEFAPATIQ